MTVEAGIYQKKQGYLQNSVLLLLAFATAFFPRILEAVGAPAPVNFLHFAIVPPACIYVIITARSKDRRQVAATAALLVGLLIFLAVMTASALLNEAGLINVFVGYLLLVEGYILLLAIIAVPFSAESFQRFRRWMLGFALVHLILAMGQKILLDLRLLELQADLTREDNIQGVFYISGGGHVVSAFVYMSFGLYYFVSAKSVPVWIRSAVVLIAFFLLVSADAKQVLMVFLLGWVILILLSVKDIRVTLQYLIAAAVIGYALYWCIENLYEFRAFKTWIRPEIYGPDGDATVLKSGPFRIIPTYYTSFLNWFFGLGPGHTIGRLGGWMLVDYGYLLMPLGGTIHPASQAVWVTWRGHYLDSSFFSPLWGWAGIWGDIGFLGLAAYLYIIAIIWQRFCVDDFCKFILITVLINGLIFTQLEEPGYMLSMTALIGLRWQEHRIERQTRYLMARRQTFYSTDHPIEAI
jgi:hypothetical protein